MITTLLLVGVLLLLSGFFSGSETALTAASRAKIHRLKTEGNKRAAMVAQLRSQKEQLIGAILLGNNAVNIGASALATSFAIEIFGQEGVVYVTIVMTFLVLIFSEVMPKTYAFRHAEGVALFVAPIFIVLVKLFYPITRLVQLVVDLFFRLFRLQHTEENLTSTDALRGAIDMHHDEGVVVKGDRDMLGGILDLMEINLEDIAVHRSQMETIDIANSADDIVDRVIGSRHTRLPVWQGNPDNIVGVLHGKAVARAYKERQDELTHDDIRELMVEPWFVPETTNLRDQLQAFREKRQHVALVVDEYGDLMGLVTLEDVLEEVVGHIEDEEDIKRHHISELPDGGYIISGSMSVRDVNREMDWDLPDDDAATIAGLVIHQAGAIPDAKQVFHFNGYRFEILRKKRNQITMLKVERLAVAD